MDQSITAGADVDKSAKIGNLLDRAGYFLSYAEANDLFAGISFGISFGFGFDISFGFGRTNCFCLDNTGFFGHLPLLFEIGAVPAQHHYAVYLFTSFRTKVSRCEIS